MDTGKTGSRVRLADGRRLAWQECGDPAGAPCVYLPGTPTAAVAGLAYDDSARRAGVRWIAVDKPGYGSSDLHPSRRLLDIGGDISRLADHLGLDRFAVAGESGGGPWALAAAVTIPDRLSAVVVAAGTGPPEAGVAGMRRDNRWLLAVARRVPWLLAVPMAATRRQLRDPARAATLVRQQLARAPQAEQRMYDDQPRLLDIAVAAGAEALRPGTRGAVQELALIARPWGFRLADVRTHVDIWHGAHDVNVPVGTARTVAAALPDCTLHIDADAGHGVGLLHADEMMATVVSAVASYR
jgi:pimeloyl-ACP methyl ester carboxylesterase